MQSAQMTILAPAIGDRLPNQNAGQFSGRRKRRFDSHKLNSNDFPKNGSLAPVLGDLQSYSH
jgi:hypothetical protein